jgi:hypothetical protein
MKQLLYVFLLAIFLLSGCFGIDDSNRPSEVRDAIWEASYDIFEIHEEIIFPEYKVTQLYDKDSEHIIKSDYMFDFSDKQHEQIDNYVQVYAKDSTLNENEIEMVNATMGVIVGYQGFFDVVDQIEELDFNNQFHIHDELKMELEESAEAYLEGYNQLARVYSKELKE